MSGQSSAQQSLQFTFKRHNFFCFCSSQFRRWPSKPWNDGNQPRHPNSEWRNLDGRPAETFRGDCKGEVFTRILGSNVGYLYRLYLLDSKSSIFHHTVADARPPVFCCHRRLDDGVLLTSAGAGSFDFHC